MIKNVDGLKIAFKKSVIVLYRMHELSVSNSETVNVDFMRDYKKLKRIYLKDTRGFEKLYLWMKVKKLPKFLDLSKYVDKIYYQYKLIKVRKIYGWNEMERWMKKNKQEQQLYYDCILEQVNKYKKMLKKEKNIMI